ncbi:DEAD/DEAH box helicase family protein [Pseudomonas qingdaonensis]|nr:DEAD/DEAH box helicase family protein [Pseudomonas qingdaonensis]
MNAVAAGLKNAERGKLIMACGTGKTFTSLKIAERLAGKGKRVLFLVPSLSLLSQTLTEWTQESETPAPQLRRVLRQRCRQEAQGR